MAASALGRPCRVVYRIPSPWREALSSLEGKPGDIAPHIPVAGGSVIRAPRTQPVVVRHHS